MKYLLLVLYFTYILKTDRYFRIRFYYFIAKTTTKIDVDVLNLHKLKGEGVLNKFLPYIVLY